MEKSEVEAVCAVCDAGPLIHLDELGCLALLEDFHTISVPSGVWDEVTRHRGDGFSFSCERVNAPGPAEPVWETLFRSLSLHRGEMEALRIAISRRDCLLLTDDMAARLAAEKCGVLASGTIGVLIRSVRRGLRTKSEILELLRQIPKRSTLHVKSALLAKVLAAVERDG